MPKKKPTKNKEKMVNLGIKLVFWVIFVALILGILYSVNKPDEDPVYNITNKMEPGNGIVTNIWMQKELTLDRFKENNMKYLFVDVGHTSEQGLLETPEREITQFLDFIDEYEKKNDYDFTLLAYSEVNTNNYDINSFEFQNNFVNDYVYLTNIGFEGILIDIEYVPKDRQESYLEITDRLIKETPNNTVISAYVVGIDKTPSHWDWTPEFFEEVEKRVDLIEFGSYDTGIENLDKYKKHLESQLEWVSKKRWDSEFILTIPTHKESPETIGNALNSYDSIMSEYPYNQFIGIAVFAEWTMDESEWKRFEEWNNKIYL